MQKGSRRLLLLVLLLLLAGCTNRSGSGQSIYASVQPRLPLLEPEEGGGADPETEQAQLPRKYVAMTFDDGPRRNTTQLLLDGLFQRSASATFFLIGQQVEGNEDLIRRMQTEGHQVGNHTFSHARLLKADQNTLIEEIKKTEVVLNNILGEGSYWLRPPYGLIDRQRAALIQTPMVYWTLDPEDWRLLDAAKVSSCVLARVQPGDIILLHDFYPTSVEAALLIIDALQAQGYAFVTVEELFQLQGTAPLNGVLYASPEKIRQVP